MHRIFLTILLVAAFAVGQDSSTTRAEDDPWQVVYEAPSPKFHAIEMFDDDHGIAASPGGMFYTRDGGLTWARSESPDAWLAAENPSLLPQWTIAFGDADHAWAADDGGRLLTTTDGGVTWATQNVAADLVVTSISAVGSAEVWATFDDESGFGTLQHSTDGGATWIRVPARAAGSIIAVEFVEDRLWIIAEDCVQRGCAGSRLLTSHDRGGTWRSVTTPLAIKSMQWLDADSGFAFGIEPYCSTASDDVCESTLLYTPDSGTSWEVRTRHLNGFWVRGNDEQNVLLYSYRFTDESNGYALASTCWSSAPGCEPTVRESNDGGRTWRQLTKDATGSGEFAIAGSRLVFIRATRSEGPNGIATLDPASGEVAPAITGANLPFTDTAFVGDNEVYAVNGRELLISSDGARTFNHVTSPDAPVEVESPAPGVIWLRTISDACDACSAIHVSTNGGATWSSHGFGEDQRGTGRLQAGSADIAWISGQNGHVRTTDGGETWVQFDDANSIGSYHLLSVDFGWSNSCDRAYCVGKFRITTDGGVTWMERALPGPNMAAWHFLSPQVGWASGTPEVRDPNCNPCQVLFRTTDGGVTWNEMSRRQGPFLGSLHFIDEQHGWATRPGDAPRFSVTHLRTTDGGVTWQQDLAPGFGQLSLTGEAAWLTEQLPVEGERGRAVYRILRRDPFAEPANAAAPGGDGRGSRLLVWASIAVVAVATASVTAFAARRLGSRRAMSA